MILFSEMTWWYWAIADVLLWAGLSGRPEAFYAAVVLSLAQAIYFGLRERGITAFPVQVRIAYAGILLFALWSPLHWLFWLPAVGTLALVLFGYCLLARLLSLLPWNRHDPLSWQLVRRVFLAKPVRGSVLQGCQASRPCAETKPSSLAPHTHSIKEVQMRIRILSLTMLAGVVGVALPAGGAHADKVFKTSAQFVLNACRGRLESAGGQTGCNRCDSGVCRDYNCSDGSNGVAKGCREIVITGRGPGQPPFQPPSSGVDQMGGNMPPHGHRRPVGLGGLNPVPRGTNNVIGNRQPILLMHAAGHPFGGRH